MIGIDLFAGAGGMSLGAAWAGVSVQYAVEKDSSASLTYKCNHKTTQVINCDIRDINGFEINNCNEPIVVFGGPPCQGFSASNRRTNNKENQQNWLYNEFLRIVFLLQPDWVIFENVVGFKEIEEGFFLKDVIYQLKEKGYTCSHMILNSEEYGVPQKRRRLFIIGSKRGKHIESVKGTQSKRISVEEAISDLPVISNGANEEVLFYSKPAQSSYARIMRGKKKKCSGNLVTKNSNIVLERYKYIHPGENWKAIPDKLMLNYSDKRRCHTGVYRRLQNDQPSVVIGNYRKNMLIHPVYDRGLSVREAARLQSFPDWYEFKGSIGQQQQQVGNAVPPLLAKAVFESILQKSGEE